MAGYEREWAEILTVERFIVCGDGTGNHGTLTNLHLTRYLDWDGSGIWVGVYWGRFWPSTVEVSRGHGNRLKHTFQELAHVDCQCVRG